MLSLVTTLPSWALFLLVWLLGILAIKAGAWVKGFNERKLKDDKPAPAGSLLAPLLGLLAFMLGFTFSITASRFSERKHLVVAQGKEIGTCYLRTDLLPDSQKAASKRLFARYVDLLVDAPKTVRIDQTIATLEAMHTE